MKARKRFCVEVEVEVEVEGVGGMLSSISLIFGSPTVVLRHTCSFFLFLNILNVVRLSESLHHHPLLSVHRRPCQSPPWPTRGYFFYSYRLDGCLWGKPSPTAAEESAVLLVEHSISGFPRCCVILKSRNM